MLASIKVFIQEIPAGDDPGGGEFDCPSQRQIIPLKRLRRYPQRGGHVTDLQCAGAEYSGIGLFIRENDVDGQHKGTCVFGTDQLGKFI